MTKLYMEGKVKPAYNSGFAKFGRERLMEGSFCIFGFLVQMEWFGTI